MAKTYLPEFFVRWRRFFGLKEGDELNSDIINVQPTVSQMFMQSQDADPRLVPLVCPTAVIPHLKIALFDSDTLSSSIIAGAGDGVTSAATLLYVHSETAGFNGVSWDRIRVPDDKLATAGASALEILPAAGANNFNRIHSILLSSDIAGLVVLSDGLPSVQLIANGSVPIVFPQGWKQDTANTAITATLAAATLAAGVTFNVEL